MNLQSFEQELQDWLDGYRAELSTVAQEFRHRNEKAARLYTDLLAIRNAAQKMNMFELDAPAAHAIKTNVWQELESPKRSQDWHSHGRTFFDRQRAVSLTTAFAAGIFVLIWLWPRLTTPVQEQDYEFYFEQHKIVSGDMLASDFGHDE